jgi:hypothetical protein
MFQCEENGDSDSTVHAQYPTKEDLMHLVEDGKVEELKKYPARVDFLNDRTIEGGDTYLHRYYNTCIMRWRENRLSRWDSCSKF